MTKLHVPLMAIIDYHGFRLLAVSVLPINKYIILFIHFLSPSILSLLNLACSLILLLFSFCFFLFRIIVYGSRDAGKTVHASNPEMNTLMKSAAARMNLKEHLVGRESIFFNLISFILCFLLLLLN